VNASELRHAFRLIAHVLAAAEHTHPSGAANSWMKVPVREHVRRALAHAERALLGVASEEDELAHAATRLLLALERREREAEGARALKATVDQRRAR
jgi:hypothetical protein